MHASLFQSGAVQLDCGSENFKWRKAFVVSPDGVFGRDSLQQACIDRDTAFVVQISVGHRGAVNLGFQGRVMHETRERTEGPSMSSRRAERSFMNGDCRPSDKAASCGWQPDPWSRGHGTFPESNHEIHPYELE